MKQLTLRQKRELIILAAIERKPVTMAEIEQRLRDAHLPIKIEELRDDVFEMGRTHGYLTAHRLEDSGAPRPDSHVGTIAVQIAWAGTKRLAELRAICPQTLIEHTNEILRAYEPAPESDNDPDGIVYLCLSLAALDAWWASLGLDGKAEAFMSHYETLANEKQHRSEGTAVA